MGIVQPTRVLVRSEHLFGVIEIRRPKHRAAVIRFDDGRSAGASCTEFSIVKDWGYRWICDITLSWTYGAGMFE